MLPNLVEGESSNGENKNCENEATGSLDKMEECSPEVQCATKPIKSACTGKSPLHHYWPQTVEGSRRREVKLP